MKVYLDQEYCTLPYAPMTPERTEETSQIMRVGNVELQKIYESVLLENNLKKKQYVRTDFRQDVFQWMQLANRPKQFAPNINGLKLKGVKVSDSVLRRITDVRFIQDEVLSGFSLLIEKLALQRWKKHRKSSLGVQDLYNEGIMGAINAIYGYSREDAVFMTFLYTCVLRKMSSAILKDNILSPWSSEAVVLHRTYEEAVLEFNKPVTFQEVCDHCQFTDAEVRIVAMTLKEVQRGWDMQHGLKMNYGEKSCFVQESECAIVNGKSIAKPRVGNTGIWSNDNVLDIDQREAIERARLQMSKFEKAVLDACMLDGLHGWQSNVASLNINPSTGKPYSRMATSLAMERIKKLVLQEYHLKKVA